MRITIESGALTGTTFRLEVGTTVIGRAHDCSIVLPDAGISGHHAEISVTDAGRATIRDLGSSHGTYVDGELCTGSWAIAAGCEIRLAGVGAVLHAGRASQPEPTTAEFPAVSADASVRNKNRPQVVILALAAILVGVAGIVLAGTLSGSSGTSDATTTPATTATAPPRPLTEREVIDRARAATVLVSTDGTPNGSGVVVDLGAQEALVLTNDHVIAGATKIAVNLDGEKPQEANLVGASGCDDLALLRTAPIAGLRPLTLGGRPEIGQQLYVFGFPATLSDRIGFTFRGARVAQLDAQLERRNRPADAVYRDLIQIDGAVIPGNSGGPLVSQHDARIVGINALSLARSGLETVAYAIAATRVEKVMKYLRGGTFVPGMSLQFDDDDPAPRIRGVSSPTLRRGGMEADSGQRLVAVDGKPLGGGELESSLRGLCGVLPELGDGVSTRVRFKIHKADGHTFEIPIDY